MHNFAEPSAYRGSCYAATVKLLKGGFYTLPLYAVNADEAWTMALARHLPARGERVASVKWVAYD